MESDNLIKVKNNESNNEDINMGNKKEEMNASLYEGIFDNEIKNWLHYKNLKCLYDTYLFVKLYILNYLIKKYK